MTEALLIFFIIVDVWLLYRNGALVIRNRELEQRLTAVSELLARTIIKQVEKPRKERTYPLPDLDALVDYCKNREN